jgi:hypothetical protein
VRIPLLLYLSGLAEAAPLVAAAAVRRPVSGARAWVLVWCVILLTESGIQLWLAARGIHNLWLSYVFSPMAAATVLWALSCWQASEVARLTMRLTIVPLLIVWVMLTLAFENTSSFSRAADPLAYLVGLIAAAFTLVTRSRAATGDLLRQDWFWVSGGMALNLGTFSMIGPLSAQLAGSDPALMMKAYEFEAVLSIVAFLAIARGMMCPPTTA